MQIRTLPLRDDWDVPIQPPARGRRSAGLFVGRRAELARLIDEVLRSPHKSILISGYRGVGKTSLVYRTLDEIEGRIDARLCRSSRLPTVGGRDVTDARVIHGR